ncbi:MAG: hypothetical protein OXT07_06320, partial [bacterium]|nr:hypothetical protein [bacterium]
MLSAPGAAFAQTAQDVAVRDQLIADQEALLSVYRCRFNIDTQLVPTGCLNGNPARPANQPSGFEGTPTAQDVAARDQLIADQEALLNVYRCRFNIDTQLVPTGCAPEPEVGQSPPTADEPAADDPAEPAADDPAADEPADTTADDPAADDPAATTADEPAADEPADTTADDPAEPADPAEPVADDTTADTADTTADDTTAAEPADPAEPAADDTTDDPAEPAADDPAADEPA